MDKIEINNLAESENIVLQFFESRIQAGFPSPAQGMFGDTIDLNRELIDNPAATFCARATGNSMTDAGINYGDLLIIDKSLDPKEGNIAVCYIWRRYSCRLKFFFFFLEKFDFQLTILIFYL